MIVLVGPSRGGKTALLTALLPEFPGLRVLDLDEDENRRVPLVVAAGGDPGGWSGRWRRNLEALQAAESGSGTVVVDVGAGSLQTEEGRRFFVARSSSMIAVSAPWETVLRRHPGRDPAEFRGTEYSVERQAVYASAKFQVDSGCAFDESLAQMRQALRQLVNGAG